jgi:predicted nuclease with TOPRIM domain
MKNKPAVQVDTTGLSLKLKGETLTVVDTKKPVSKSKLLKHFKDRIKELEKENKDFKEMVNGWNEERDKLEKENKELKEKIKKIQEVGGTIFLKGLLKRILKGQHEVIDATNMLRIEVIDKSHIKQVFEDLAISEEEINF